MGISRCDWSRLLCRKHLNICLQSSDITAELNHRSIARWTSILLTTPQPTFLCMLRDMWSMISWQERTVGNDLPCISCSSSWMNGIMWTCALGARLCRRNRQRNLYQNVPLGTFCCRFRKVCAPHRVARSFTRTVQLLTRSDLAAAQHQLSASWKFRKKIRISSHLDANFQSKLS